MKMSLVISVLLLCVSVGVSQQSNMKTSERDQLTPIDNTESWWYPFQAPEQKIQSLRNALEEFKGSILLDDLVRKVGKPDRIDDLSKQNKPLSPFESSFIVGSKGRFSYRFVWFARKESKSPGLSDSWLAAYLDKDVITVSVMHDNWLKKK